MSTPAETNPVASALEAVAPAPISDSPNGILDAMKAFQSASEPAPTPPVETPAAPPPADPVEAPATETDPDLSDLPPGSTTEAKETWKTLKQTKKQLAEEVEAAKRSLEAERKLRNEMEEKLKQTPTIDPEVEAKTARLAELEKKVAMVDIESTDAYRQSVLIPAAAIDKEVDMIVKSYDGTDDQVGAILQAFTETNLKTRREKLTELTSDMDPMDAAAIKSKANEFQALLVKRDEIKADAVEALKEARANEERKRDQMTQMERAAYKTAVTEAKARLATGLKDKFGDSIVTALDSAADSVSGDKFEFSDPNVKAFAALSAAALPTIVSAFTKLKAEKAELEATLAAYDKASPKPGGVPAVSQPGPDPISGVYGTGDILSRMRQAAGGA